MRNANEELKRPIRALVASRVNPKTLVVDDTLGAMVGETARNAYQDEIRELNEPPNAPSTVEMKTKGKGGETTPLIDTGKMRQSVSYKLLRFGSDD